MRLLLLAGTGEARTLAEALSSERRLSVIASLAGATRTPVSLGVPTRIGGFGGREGFESFLDHEGIGAVLDATHPFATRISHRTAEVCADRHIPYMQFLRRAWLPVEGDAWVFLNEECEAARHIPSGARVFVATGRRTLERLTCLEGRYLYVRQIDPPEAPFPLDNGEYVVGRPPFSVEDEETLFHRLGIDWLVVKNAGGAASRSKLDAARNLGIPVAMIRRPLQPEAPKVETVSEALAWVRRRL